MDHLKIMCFNIDFVQLIFEYKYQHFSMKVKIYSPKRAYCFSFKVPKKACNAYF